MDDGSIAGNIILGVIVRKIALFSLFHQLIFIPGWMIIVHSVFLTTFLIVLMRNEVLK